ncbi:MAG: DUF1003 domain-containing protein [Janthinobacterium lividum]
MPCNPAELRHIPLFSLLDDEELAVLASQVEIRRFAARQRIYKMGSTEGCAYILLTGATQVTTVDQDQQEVVVAIPEPGEFFGIASMLEGTGHRTSAVATEDATCVELDRNDISVLLSKKPMAGLDMMTGLARQFHAAQDIIRLRSNRNPNEIIEEKETRGEKIADKVASFGGSWTFIITFGVVLLVYTGLNELLRGKAWDPYPFILLNLFLSMLAAIQAPVIMMSQNRQDKKDRVRSELDFDVNVRAETEIQALSAHLRALEDKMHDVEEQLRKPSL